MTCDKLELPSEVRLLEILAKKFGVLSKKNWLMDFEAKFGEISKKN